MADYQKLDVWAKAHALSVEIYRMTRRMRQRDAATIRGHLQRSAHSVPATIAEGAGKTGDPEFARFLEMALASASETHYHLIAARDHGFVTMDVVDPLADRVAEVRRMLVGLLRTVRRRMV